MSTSARPRDSGSSACTSSATRAVNPSLRGSGIVRGTYRSACSRKSNGDPTTSSRARVQPETAAHERRVLARRQRRRDQDRRRARLPRAGRSAPARPRPGPRRGRPAPPTRRARARRARGTPRPAPRRRGSAGRAGRAPRPGPRAPTRARQARPRARAPPRPGPRAAAAARPRATTARSSRSPAVATRSSARAGTVSSASRQARSTSRASRCSPARDTRPPSQVAAVSSSRCASSKIDRVVLGKHAAARGHVGEVQRVVRDHELGLGRTPPRSLREARREQRAAAAGAAVGADGELGPQCVRRLERQLGAVAGLGLGEPRLQRLERLLVARVAEQHRPEASKLLAAHVVLPALEHDDVDLAPERRGRPRARPSRAAAPAAPSSRSRRRRAARTRAPGSGRRGSCPSRSRPRRAGARPVRAPARPPPRARPAPAAARSREAWPRGSRRGRTPACTSAKRTEANGCSPCRPRDAKTKKVRNLRETASPGGIDRPSVQPIASRASDPVGLRTRRIRHSAPVGPRTCRG